MKKSLLILSTLIFVSCKMFAPGVRVDYRDGKDLLAQIDYGEANGWTKINKLDKNKKYDKKSLQLLSSDSGKRYIYWKVGNSIYRTQENYTYPEIITIGLDGKTYTLETTAGEKDKDKVSTQISEKTLNEQIKLSSKTLNNYKYKKDEEIKNIKKIDYKSDADPIKTLKNMIVAQQAVINDKIKRGVTKEELKFEEAVKTAMESQKKKLEDEKKATDKKKAEAEEKKKKKESEEFNTELSKLTNLERGSLNDAVKLGKSIYSIFGISLKASDSEIKSTYKNLSFKYHPDTTKEKKEVAEAKLSGINTANEIFKNKNLKNFYDKYYLPQYQKETSQKNNDDMPELE